jgi:two-component system capsular synthesis sensor histidine kinase RcsC
MALQGSATEFEWRNRRPNGEVWDAMVHQTTFMHGHKILVMVTLDDITLRKRAEQAIRSAKEAAEEAARVKSDFLAVTSHEIRTPLNAMLGNLELLERAWSSDVERERLRNITVASHRLLDIINDTLDFSKVGAGRLHLEQLPFDLVLAECFRRRKCESRFQDQGSDQELQPGTEEGGKHGALFSNLA